MSMETAITIVMVAYAFAFVVIISCFHFALPGCAVG